MIYYYHGGDRIKRYKKGIETRNSIIQASKTLFYTEGYDNTTVQKIADLASVNLGLLSYYFKTKNNIIRIIFGEFAESVENAVCDVFNKESNLILFFMIKERIIYDIIFNDPKNSRFFKETLHKNIIDGIMEEYTLMNLQTVNQKHNLNLEEYSIKSFSALQVGGALNVLKKFYNQDIDIPQDQLINILIGCIPKLFGIDHQTAMEYLEQSLEYQQKASFSDIKFLI